MIPKIFSRENLANHKPQSFNPRLYNTNDNEDFMISHQFLDID